LAHGGHDDVEDPAFYSRAHHGPDLGRLGRPGAPTTTAPAELERPGSGRTASATPAGPVALTEAQLDTITAGGGNTGGGPWLDRSIISSQGSKLGMGTEEDD